MGAVIVKFMKLRPEALAPKRAYDGDAGWDLFVCETTVINHEGLTWLPTGIALSIPGGFYGRIVGRSSSASRGLHVVEGVIDSGYRGEQMFRVARLWRSESDRSDAIVQAGESVGQLIIQPVPDVMFVEAGQLSTSARGVSGYGSSGA